MGVALGVSRWGTPAGILPRRPPDLGTLADLPCRMPWNALGKLHPRVYHLTSQLCLATDPCEFAQLSCPLTLSLCATTPA